MTTRSEGPRRSGWLLAIALAIATSSLSIIALKYLDAPFVWIAVFFTAALLTAARLTSKTSLKALWWNLAVACIVLGAIEAYLLYQQAPARRDTIKSLDGEPQALSEPDDVLGYAPIKNRRGIWTRHIGEELVFSIEYSIDSLGMRTAPPTDSSTDVPCVFFFGGSYTFGSGVNDAETYAYLVGVKTDGKYRTFNFGFRGYGPHQMLAALESNAYEQDLQCQPRHVVYQMIPDHVRRAAGFSSWDTNGPRYALDDAGNVVLAGRFSEKRSDSPGLVGRLLRRSIVYRRLLGFFEPQPDRRSSDLTVAIIQRASRIVRERHPDGAFHVVFWPSDQPAVKPVIDALLDSDLNVHSMAEILPEFETGRDQYRLHPHDGHPNVRAHGFIADFVVGKILTD